MKKKVLALFSREVGGLHEAAFLLGISSLGSALLALLRDRLLAHTFGASRDLDIYYTAFSIPDFLNVTVASFVAVTVLIPLLVKRLKNTDGGQEASRFLSEVFLVYAGIMILVAIAGYVLMPFFAVVVVPSFDERAQALFVLLSRILLLQPFLLGLSNLLGSVTQSMRRFALLALSPLLYNLGIILGIVFLYPLMGLPGLVWGVVLGALFHMLIQVPALVSSGLSLGFVRSIRWREIRDVVALSLPRSIGLGMTQILTIALFRLASDMHAGSVALFQFADNLQAVPLGIIGVSYSTAAFPSLARLISEGKPEHFARHVSTALRHILYWSLFLSALLFVLAPDLVVFLLGSGRFGAGDSTITGISLALFAFSVAPQGVLLLFTRSYYAAGDTAKPVYANTFSMCITMALALLFVYLYETIPSLAHALDQALGLMPNALNEVVVLPIAFSIGMVVNALLHAEAFILDFLASPRAILGSFARSMLLALFTGAFAFLFRSFLVEHTSFTNAGSFSNLAIVGIGSFLFFVLFSYAIARSEFEEVFGLLRRKVMGAGTVA